MFELIGPERLRELVQGVVLARGSLGLPVQSFLVLLRPSANASDLTGTHAVAGLDGADYLTFRYTVIRVWLESVTNLLNAGLGLAPLALLTNEAATDLDAAFEQFERRLRAESVPDIIRKGMYGSLHVLCGLRYTPERINKLYETLSMTLEDSTIY